ncbi:MAG: hypothetical protein WA637_07990, partial [Terriglobales bacterium]
GKTDSVKKGDGLFDKHTHSIAGESLTFDEIERPVGTGTTPEFTLPSTALPRLVPRFSRLPILRLNWITNSTR